LPPDYVSAAAALRVMLTLRQPAPASAAELTLQVMPALRCPLPDEHTDFQPPFSAFSSRLIISRRCRRRMASHIIIAVPPRLLPSSVAAMPR